MIGVLQRGDLLRARADTKPPALCRLPAPYEADIWLGLNFNLFLLGPLGGSWVPGYGLEIPSTAQHLQNSARSIVTFPCGREICLGSLIACTASSVKPAQRAVSIFNVCTVTIPFSFET
jgi:hypothetical protein